LTCPGESAILEASKKEKTKGFFSMLMFRRMTTLTMLTKRTIKRTVTPMGSFDGGP
jgi:hypothetical protein